MFNNSAFLVCGPESSGNHLAAQVLCLAGCLGSWTDEHQWFNKEIPPAQQPLVWAFSYPRDRRWVPMNLIAYQVVHAGYMPRLVLPMREVQAMCKSQVARGRVEDETTAFNSARVGLTRIFQHIIGMGLDYYWLPYTALTVNPVPVIDGLLRWAQLDADPAAVAEQAGIYRGNLKHYNKEPNRANHVPS
jgi:hypothetical protein